MQSFSFFLSLLQCPYCQKKLAFTRIQQEETASEEYGILSCACSAFPVIDGIPILLKSPVEVKSHTTGTIEVPGPTSESLIDLIQKRRAVPALLSLITFPYFPPSLRKYRLLRSIFHRNPIEPITLHLRKTFLRNWSLPRLNSLTAQDWFTLFYERSLMYGDLYNYFFFRFAQPRYLASLSLLSTFPAEEKPILDLAGGFAHLGHYLTECEKAHDVITIDRNFFQLWVAKHWITPKGFYVCADAEQPLPFQDGSLGGVVFSDGIHLIDDKEKCLREMRRCVSQGTIIFARTGNRLVKPKEGKGLSPSEYYELINTSNCRFLGETELLESYIHGFGPDLQKPKDPEAFDREKWISIVISDNPKVLKNHGKFQIWPHSVGTLRLNPIYKVSHATNNDHLQLSLHFPSDWFAYENSLMAKYYEFSVTFDKKICDQIRANERTQAINDLISRFIVIGMPEKYLRSRLLQAS